MITFLCKKISDEDLIRCAFALNKTEYNLLIFLLDRSEEYTASHISKLMKLDRTTIQKAMKNLADKGLVKRIQRNIIGGGYTFLYIVKDKRYIKGKIRKVVNKWCMGVKKAIDEL